MLLSERLNGSNPTIKRNGVSLKKTLYYMEDKNTVWLNPNHPNYARWLRGRLQSRNRAKTVKGILSSVMICKGLNILDIGSGEGQTAAIFAENNNVISLDLNLLRIKRQQLPGNNFFMVNGNAEMLPFSKSFFDIIICQDVIEHIGKRELLINELNRVLKNDGLIYVSTPNKHSVLNIISDPHWGIPLLSLFKRNSIKRYFLRFFRKDDLYRTDIAELLSLGELQRLFNGFRLYIKAKEVVELMSEYPQGIIWSSFHLFLYQLLKRTGLLFVLRKTANNKAGLINKIFTPTFYLIIKAGN